MADQDKGDPQGGKPDPDDPQGGKPDPDEDPKGGKPDNDDDGWDGPFDEDRAKSLIDKLREERRELRRENRELKKTPKTDPAKGGKPDNDDDRPDPDTIRRQVEAEVRAEAARDVAGARLEALAGKVLADPTDASRFIDVDDILDSDGKLDPDLARDELKALLEKRPYLAAEQKPKTDPLKGGGGQGSGGWSLDDEIRRQAGVK